MNRIYFYFRYSAFFQNRETNNFVVIIFICIIIILPLSKLPHTDENLKMLIYKIYRYNSFYFDTCTFDFRSDKPQKHVTSGSSWRIQKNSGLWQKRRSKTRSTGEISPLSGRKSCSGFEWEWPHPHISVSGPGDMPGLYYSTSQENIFMLVVTEISTYHSQENIFMLIVTETPTYSFPPRKFIGKYYTGIGTVPVLLLGIFWLCRTCHFVFLI